MGVKMCCVEDDDVVSGCVYCVCGVDVDLFEFLFGLVLYMEDMVCVMIVVARCVARVLVFGDDVCFDTGDFWCVCGGRDDDYYGVGDVILFILLFICFCL